MKVKKGRKQDRENMTKKLLLAVFLILLIPSKVYAAVYGSEEYGCGLYGVGCSAEALGEDDEPGGGDDTPVGGGTAPGGGSGSGDPSESRLLRVSPAEAAVGDEFTFNALCKWSFGCIIVTEGEEIAYMVRSSGFREFTHRYDSAGEKTVQLFHLGTKPTLVAEKTVKVTEKAEESPQFDIKILDFESPINLGESFNFMYFVKGVGEINADVTISFRIEKNGKIITSGSDVIFMGSNEEKTESASLFMPSEIDSGTYTFIIEVNYGNIKAEAHRTIELTVKDGKATIYSLFDIRFSLEEILMQSSDELYAIVIFENFGTETTEVNLTFTILDEEKNEIYRGEDAVTVETEEVLRKSFKGLNLDTGKYTVILQTLYGADVADEFRQDFEIRKELLFSLPKDTWILFLTGLVIFGLLVWITKLREKKESEKSDVQKGIKETKTKQMIEEAQLEKMIEDIQPEKGIKKSKPKRRIKKTKTKQMIEEARLEKMIEDIQPEKGIKKSKPKRKTKKGKFKKMKKREVFKG